MKATVAYLEAQHLDTLVEDIDVDVNFCEEVISSLEKDFCSELRLFITDKEQHAIRYPDTIWRFSGYQFVRPKFWITHNGVERGSFSRQYRELKEIRRAQKLNDVVRELKQVKKALSPNANQKKSLVVTVEQTIVDLAVQSKHGKLEPGLCQPLRRLATCYRQMITIVLQQNTTTCVTLLRMENIKVSKICAGGSALE